MSIRHSFPLYPETYFASRAIKRPASAQYTPRQNHLLAALSVEDYERLLPDLEPVPLPVGRMVYRAGDREKYVYFLTSGLVSKGCITESGATIEFALAGSEGVVGIASFLGGMSLPSHAVVLSAGHAYRLEADLVMREFEQDRPLAHLLLRYTCALIVQTGQIAACNRHHTLEQQLCRWLLSGLDRTPTGELTMTQEVIAEMLGVRREGVTEAAGKLQRAGLIHYSRGHIDVFDRSRLEALVCECYSVVKREYDRLLPEYRQAEVAV